MPFLNAFGCLFNDVTADVINSFIIHSRPTGLSAHGKPLAHGYTTDPKNVRELF